MSNSYTKASFVLTITGFEAFLLRTAKDAVDIVADDTIDQAEVACGLDVLIAEQPEEERDGEEHQRPQG